MSGHGPACPPVGYRVVLPPGWLQLPVRHAEPATVLDAVLAEAFADLPADRYGPARRMLRDRALPLLERARADGALEVWAPLLGVRGTAVPVSVVVRDLSFAPLPSGADGDATAGLLAAVAAQATTDGGAGGVVRLPSGPAARTTRTVPGDEHSGGTAALQVTHHLPVPNAPDRWVVVTCAVPADAGPVTSTLVDLFDAMMTTWRWRDADVLL